MSVPGVVMVFRSLAVRGLMLVALGALIPLAGCGGPASEWPDKSPKVVASFPPLFCFALNVAGDDAAVKSAMTNQGPHHYDPTPSDARMLRQADVFFINGLGLDDKIATKLRDGSGNTALRIVNLGEGIDPSELEESCGCCHGEEGHDHAHEHTTDPHVWLGIGHAIKQVEGIRKGLGEIDPARAANYDRRAAEYTARLRQLEADGKALLKDKKDRKFVTFHGSLTYFAHTFDLEIVDVIQKVPGKEPSAKELQKLVDTCVEEKVRIIAVEPQYSGQASAKRILEELRRKGVQDPVLVEIDPLETAQGADLNAEWYEARMRRNLQQLADALK